MIDFEILRRTKDYIDVKRAFNEEPSQVLDLIKERLVAHGELVEIYKKEAKKILKNPEQKQICLMGVDETIQSGKMIAKWIGRLKKDFPEYDFSPYSDLMKVAERMESYKVK